MAPPQANAKTVQYRRTHNLLLGTRLLSQRGTPSPFTLILDSLEQSSAPLVEEYISRAKLLRVNIIYISFTTLRPPKNVTKIIKARGKSLDSLQRELITATTPVAGGGQPDPTKVQNMIIIDSTNHLVSISSEEVVVGGGTKTNMSLSYFLSSILAPSVTIIATYHTDIPRIRTSTNNAYNPDPLDLLKYLCTTLITVYSPSHIFSQKRALDKSLPPPSFGLDEGVEGSLTSLGSNTGWCETCGINEKSRGLIYELEHRRVSGRAMSEWFFLLCHAPSKKSKERLILLEDHPAYNPTIVEAPSSGNGSGGAVEDSDLTFSLGLTAKQKSDREGVVLPYFDAQSEEGGTGGRILYVPGREDDWDDEEDEI
ncbi:hypothetical protein TWF102_000998 [Orbilia oligospora]|uniref:Elongator complex protein 5 n=1 Tax=Orbilia oligospora TaxID=2813651 RepID=A0A7C8N1M5_ORBOL|nr:hypothetical protein TWF102_000998 [Orbilia oligospora]KAF3087350.1 hypothetical protein TWF706_011210 [Orbilia oligospora]KAF3110318.1 hypothetical protein TWF103_004610 [Orbilia oligospora]KAF3132397.1 hypothetical protein TWF594_009526 [Orbilia oligospora]